MSTHSNNLTSGISHPNARPTSLRRSATWPTIDSLSSLITPNGEVMNMIGAVSRSAPQSDGLVLEDIDQDFDVEPQAHFLSAMNDPDSDNFYSMYGPDSDEDDDGSEIEWNAGIMDFSLFNDDRRRSEETNEPLSSKWDYLLQSQRRADERCAQRQLDSERHRNGGSKTGTVNDVPALTPDTSPRLQDNLEDGEDDVLSSNHSAQIIKITVTPPSEDTSPTKKQCIPAFRFPTAIVDDEQDEYEDDEDLPLSFFVNRSLIKQPSTRRKIARPGLRGSRTLSGQSHSWIRPPINLYSLGERPEDEQRAEQGLPDLPRPRR
ncbi:Hypothetical protein R9X50_00159100 [Acrodontium crateriforme]|uniref:Uncharacterized protein n=1 Tax=Acrodontium crateriforme TaxID=150365 RepID=A0AAQ3M2Q5_9PEZI|nr:Hypothetical protein R9X50_00159100 [Acrodontium crateriforme]